MDGHRSPFHISFPLGTWFDTRVRVSVWFPVIAIILCYKFQLQLGLLLTVLLTFSVLLHEFFHVFAARGTGGSADEILIWPAGGLAFRRPAANPRSQFLTAAAGPLANLLLCLAMFPVVYRANFPPGVFHPFVIPHVELGDDIVQDICLLIFAVNWLLLLINLLPVYPLDGGQMLMTALTRHVDPETARFASLRIGMTIGILAAIAGLMFEQIWLVFLGFLVFSMGMYEHFMAQLSDQFDESFMGYDFSQGYTSLERSQSADRQRRPGPIKRWQARRAEQKRIRDEQERVETEQRLDELLAKVHRDGMDALTDAERRFLKHASGRYRSKDHPG